MAESDIEVAKRFIVTANKNELMLLLKSLGNQTKHGHLEEAILKLLVTR
jgi:hypothetical protein